MKYTPVYDKLSPRLKQKEGKNIYCCLPNDA